MRTPRVIVLMFALALVIAACGGDGDSSEEFDGGGDEQGQSSGNDNGSSGNDVPSDDFVVPDIDPSTMPPPGEARVEVAGKTFTFVKDPEQGERLFACEVREDGISVNFQDEGHDLLLMGATQSDGSILASVTVQPEGEGFRYDSTNGGGRGGGVALEGPHILYVGQFDATPDGDPVGFEDVGDGSVAVTCP